MRARRTGSTAVASLLFLAACGGSASNASGSGSAGGCSGSGDVVVGLIAPKTGAAATIVGEFSRGAEEAVSEVNAKGGVCGGRKLRLVEKDDSGAVTKDADLSKQLVEQDKAVGVVMISDDSFAVAGSYLQQHHILDVGAYVSDQLDDPQNAVDTFSVAIPNALERKQYTDYLFGQQHVQHPAVIYETSSSYGRTQAKSFCDDAQKAGHPCVDQETTTLDTTDVSEQIGKMKGAGADSVLIEGFGIPVVKAVGTARAAGITGPLLGTGTTATSASLIAGFVPAEARQGYVYVNYRSAVQNDPGAATQLAKRLEQKAPLTEPLFIPMFSYDAVELMVRGWNGANSLDADAASQAIEKLDVKAGSGLYLHDYKYSAQHHEPQVDGWLTLCVADPLDSNGLAKKAG